MYGDYWRLLLPGTYYVTVSHSGHANTSHMVTVTEGSATVQNFTLVSVNNQWSMDQDYGIVENLDESYLSNEKLHSTLRKMAKENPDLIRTMMNPGVSGEMELQFVIINPNVCFCGQF